MTRHQYGISTLVSQTSFRGETSGSVAKFRLFSQATLLSIADQNANSPECEWTKLIFFALLVEKKTRKYGPHNGFVNKSSETESGVVTGIAGVLMTQ